MRVDARADGSTDNKMFSYCAKLFAIVCRRVFWCSPDRPLSLRVRQRELRERERERERERKREKKKGNAAVCRIMKNGTARYILMQILYRILVLGERTIHFLSTRNSTFPTATCLSRDVCIVQLKDIQEYAKGAWRYFGELPLHSVAHSFKYARMQHKIVISRKCAIWII